MTPAKMDYVTGKFNYGDWEDVWFVKDNHVYQFNNDTNNNSLFKQLNDTDYSKCIDGTNSGYNITSNLAFDIMASFPLCWIHRSQKSDGTRVVKISNKKVDDTYHAYGWEDDNGNVQDVFYVGAFETTTSNMYNEIHSNGSFPPSVNKTLSTVITHVTQKGSGWNPLDFCKWSAIQDLCILISKTTDSQKAFGNGICSGGIINTGTLNSKGRFYGANNNTTAMKAFHLENLWGNTRTLVTGLLHFNNWNFLFKTHAPYNVTGSGYTTISNINTLSSNQPVTINENEIMPIAENPATMLISGLIYKGKETQYGFIPTQTITDTYVVYDCDGVSITTPADYGTLALGGSSTTGNEAGIYCMQQVSSDSYTSTRLAYTPQGTTNNPKA